MPKAGGVASKEGLLYEIHWTIKYGFLRVLDGKASSIHLEPSGPIGQGIEFYLDVDGQREYHQCKINAAAWTVAPVTNVLVPLRASLRKATESGNHHNKIRIATSGKCVLSEIGKYRRSPSPPPEGWRSLLPDSADKFYAGLVESFWDNDFTLADKEVAHIVWDTIGETTLSEDIVSDLEKRFSGNGVAALHNLSYLALSSSGSYLMAADINEHLQKSLSLDFLPVSLLESRVEVAKASLRDAMKSAVDAQYFTDTKLIGLISGTLTSAELSPVSDRQFWINLREGIRQVSDEFARVKKEFDDFYRDRFRDFNQARDRRELRNGSDLEAITFRLDTSSELVRSVENKIDRAYADINKLARDYFKIH